MSFKKLTPEPSGRAESTSVRLANYDGKQPRITIPVCILDELGARIGSQVDLMIDEDSQPRKLAIVTPGKTAKLLKAPGRGALVSTNILRKAIPTFASMATHHEIGRIDGCAALIIDLPDAAPLSKEREEA